jgi:hypothetical protein
MSSLSKKNSKRSSREGSGERTPRDNSYRFMREGRFQPPVVLPREEGPKTTTDRERRHHRISEDATKGPSPYRGAEIVKSNKAGYKRDGIGHGERSVFSGITRVGFTDKAPVKR